jgi:hypothetical protein
MDWCWKNQGGRFEAELVQVGRLEPNVSFDLRLKTPDLRLHFTRLIKKRIIPLAHELLKPGFFRYRPYGWGL